jgi:hypothetical protein
MDKNRCGCWRGTYNWLRQHYYDSKKINLVKEEEFADDKN